MTKSPLISIILPIYNVEKYLKKCLTSLIAQKYTNLEILCIYNNSTDKTLAILENIQKTDNRIVIYKHTINDVSSARNLGISESKGEYICFVDSDDWVDELYIEKLLNNLRTNKSDIAVASYYFFNERTQKLLQSKINTVAVFSSHTVSVEDFLSIFGDFDVFVWGRMYKAKIVKENNILFPEGLIYEDGVFNLKFYLYMRKISFINEKLYYYRINSQDSLTTLSNKYAGDFPKIFKIMKNLLDDKGVYNKYKEALFKHSLKSLMMLARKKNNLKLNFYKESSKILQIIDDKYLSNKKELLLKHHYLIFYFKYKILNFSWLIFYFRVFKRKLLKK